MRGECKMMKAGESEKKTEKSSFQRKNCKFLRQIQRITKEYIKSKHPTDITSNVVHRFK